MRSITFWSPSWQIWISLQIKSKRRLLAANGGWRTGLLFVVIPALIAISGCAVHRVRADFNGFEKAYADTSNRELLLNLARLQNHDPTYFFKMGQITSSYRMSASVPTSVGYASQSSVSGKSNTTGGATPALSYESDPLFQFIPVNDEENAQLLLKQIPAETFYILYQQGWRIDQLFRLMVDRIEVTQPDDFSDPSKGCDVSIYRNVPPTLGDPNDPLETQELGSYAGFLRASAIAYSLQRHGNLALREFSKFVPLDTNAVSAGPSSGAGSGGGQSSSADNTPSLGDHPPTGSPGTDTPSPAPAAAKPGPVSATDIEKAAEKSLSFETYKVPSPPGSAPSTAGAAAGAAPAAGATTSAASAPAIPAAGTTAAGTTSTGRVLIGQRLPDARFYLIPSPQLPPPLTIPAGIGGILYNLVNDPRLKNLAQELTDKHYVADQPPSGEPNPCQKGGSPDISVTAFCLFVNAVQNGFAIEDDVSQPVANGGPCPVADPDNPLSTSQQNVTARLVLRSLIGVMAAAAQEQEPFDQLLQSAKDNKGPNFRMAEEPKGLNFYQAVPETEQTPILRINWKPDYAGAPDLRPMPDLIELNYRETDYRVADPFKDEVPVTENQYWNRDVFRLIAALTAQVTVDTSKYPIANILQLNSVQ
jgi:hypothetical protein